MNIKQIYKSILLAVICLSSGYTLVAQDNTNVNKDVKVVGEYNPIISDANKLSNMPNAENSSLAETPSFDYSIMPISINPKNEFLPLSPAKLSSERYRVLDNSYAKLFIGNYNTIGGELFYNFPANKDYSLSIDLGHTSSFGKIKLEDDNKVDAPYHDTWLSLDFNRYYKEHILSIDANFMNNKYNYYGYNTINDSLNYMLPTDNYSGSDILNKDEQRLTSFDLGARWANLEYDTEEVPYQVLLNTGYFNNLSGISEFNFKLGGDVSFMANDNIGLKLDASLDFYSTSSSKASSIYLYNDRNMGIFSFSPYLLLDYDNVDIEAGIDTYTDFTADNNVDFNIAPHVDVDLTIAEEILSAYGGVKGKFNTNNYEAIQRENYFVAPDLLVLNSFYNIDIYAGLKGNFSSSTSFNLGIDFSTFENEHFFVNRSYQSTDLTLAPSQANVFDVVYDDGNVFTVSGEVKYDAGNNFNISILGNYYAWSLDSYEYAWHKPDFELEVNSSFSPLDDLWINVGANVIGARHALDVTDNSAKSLDAVFDLNAGALYKFSSRWNMFADISNLINSKYYMWNGYPSQGINVRLGVGYSF